MRRALMRYRFWEPSETDLHTSLPNFRKSRARLLQLIESLEASEWSQTGRHSEWGILSAKDLVQIILGHDQYHMRQVAEWIA